MQSGGWSLTWQGDNTKTSDYPNAETLLAAMRKSLGADRVDYSVDGTGVDVSKYSGVVMVAAEQPYAEMKGDIIFPAPLRHTARYPQDLQALDRVSGKGVPVVTVALFRTAGCRERSYQPVGRLRCCLAAGNGGPGHCRPSVCRSGRHGQLTISPAGFRSTGRRATACRKQGGYQFRRGYGLSLAGGSRLGRLPEAAVTMACPAESR